MKNWLPVFSTNESLQRQKECREIQSAWYHADWMNCDFRSIHTKYKQEAKIRESKFRYVAHDMGCTASDSLLSPVYYFLHQRKHHWWSLPPQALIYCLLPDHSTMQSIPSSHAFRILRMSRDHSPMVRIPTNVLVWRRSVAAVNHPVSPVFGDAPREPPTTM